MERERRRLTGWLAFSTVVLVSFSAASLMSPATSLLSVLSSWCCLDSSSFFVFVSVSLSASKIRTGTSFFPSLFLETRFASCASSAFSVPLPFLVTIASDLTTLPLFHICVDFLCSFFQETRPPGEDWAKCLRASSSSRNLCSFFKRSPHSVSGLHIHDKSSNQPTTDARDSLALQALAG